MSVYSQDISHHLHYTQGQNLETIELGGILPRPNMSTLRYQIRNRHERYAIAVNTITQRIIATIAAGRLGM